MDLFVSLWLLAQPLLVICYLCIATMHQKLWIAGVELNQKIYNILLTTYTTNTQYHLEQHQHQNVL